MATKNNNMAIIIHALANPVKVLVHQYKATPAIKIIIAKMKRMMLLLVELFMTFIYE
jgi:hypothetical protein